MRISSPSLPFLRPSTLRSKTIDLFPFAASQTHNGRPDGQTLFCALSAAASDFRPIGQTLCLRPEAGGLAPPPPSLRSVLPRFRKRPGVNDNCLFAHKMYPSPTDRAFKFRPMRKGKRKKFEKMEKDARSAIRRKLQRWHHHKCAGAASTRFCERTPR